MYIRKLREKYALEGDTPSSGYRYEVYPFLGEHPQPHEIGMSGVIVVRVDEGKPIITCNISFANTSLSIADTMQLMAGLAKAVELSQTAEFVRPKSHPDVA